MEDTGRWLEPGEFLDSDHEAVRRFAAAHGAASDPAARARALYLAVRDGVRYDPYKIPWGRADFKASRCLERGVGYCVTKAGLLAAAARAAGIPARMGFADVRNHLTTARLRALMGTDVFVWHGYAELFVQARWVKVTCAFPARLCARFGVPPLDFDGRSDALFQALDGGGRRFMEYVRDRGRRDDLPYEEIVEAMGRSYPLLYGAALEGDFEDEGPEARP